MIHKVEHMAGKLTQVVSSWPGVECVVSGEASNTEVYDPYFALVLDVYCKGSIPESAKRQSLFDNPGAFETSRSGEKDRFFLDGLPIRLEYKRTRNIEDLISSSFETMRLFGETGTYVIYRFVNGKTLYTRSDWLDRTREAIVESPTEFWEQLRETYQQKMEHSLSDLGGAALKEDRFFYIVSVAGFMRSCVSSIFAINRQWEPSERNMKDALMSLPVLPEDFQGRWETILRVDGSTDPAKCFQIAQLIVKSVYALG
ncbi:MAG: DUF4037 domain-containing protein [Spirochaetia bacterium]|jgi:hypothetical protein|nr:DUF4037 domain-containing protein [Spirochaetia bacterium]